MNAVIKFDGLTKLEQGEFLRRQGLMSEHVIEWKKVWEQALELTGEVSTFSRAEQLEMILIARARYLNFKDLF